jgi:hypothetical protein
MNKKSPCEKCPKDGTKKCDYRNCGRWLTYYRHKQAQINAYARKVLPAYYASLGKGGDGGGGQ